MIISLCSNLPIAPHDLQRERWIHRVPLRSPIPFCHFPSFLLLLNHLIPAVLASCFSAEYFGALLRKDLFPGPFLCLEHIFLRSLYRLHTQVFLFPLKPAVAVAYYWNFPRFPSQAPDLSLCIVAQIT